jgi:hypothetical protein
MIAQRNGRRKERLKGRLLYRFGSGALVAGVEVVVEKRTEVDLVEWIGGCRRFRQLVRRGRIGHGASRLFRIRKHGAVDGGIRRIAIERAGFGWDRYVENLLVGGV